MKRRDFLKLIGVAVVAPGTVVAAVKAKQCKHEWRLFGPGLDCRCRLCGIRGNLGGAYVPWKNYYATYHFESDVEKCELLKQFKKAFKNTKMILPNGKQIYAPEFYNAKTPH